MNAETIKNFLVRLGFAVDKADARKLASVAADATASVMKMGSATEIAALPVLTFTQKIASGLDNLYETSLRTGASVQGVKQIGYAGLQGSAEAAHGSLESIASRLKLGFDVDEAGSHKFTSVAADVTAGVMKVGGAIEATALSVLTFTTRIASGLDNLYKTSLRTGATVQGIEQIRYAVLQAGGSADAAYGSLEGIANFMRKTPDAEGFLSRLGVQTRDASGNMRDMAAVLTDVGQQLSKMPDSRANQYAQMLGIDDSTLLAMRRGLDEYSAQYMQMREAIGLNPDRAAVSSHQFMTSLNAFEQLAGMIQDKVGSTLAEGLAGSIDRLFKVTLENFPKIDELITQGVEGILWLSRVIERVIYRFIQAVGDMGEWWGTLDKGTQQLIITLGGLVIAWRILNSAFLASPIGIITSLGLAILALYDDYKKWQEGGQSLIDWEQWKPGINSTRESIEGLTASLKSCARDFADLLGIDPKEWSFKWEFSDLTHNLSELGKMLKLIGELLNAINEGRWSDAASIGKQLLHQGNGQLGAMPKVTDSANNSADWIKKQFGFDPRSVGKTVKGWFSSDYHEPEQLGQSVKRRQPTIAGTAMLGWLQPTISRLDQFYPLRVNAGDLNKTLASYNQGIDNIQRYGMALMPGETREFTPKVMRNMSDYGAASSTVHQQNTYNIYGGNAREIGDQVGRSVSENAISIGKHRAGVS